jgi:HAD superfamily hydrolase (TIGR01450 family)
MTERADGVAAPADALATTYDVALLDLDGVVYRGAEAVPRAVEAIAEVTQLGMRRVFVTNNASRTPAAVAGQLERLGIPAEPNDVVTSAQAAARRLGQLLPAGAAVLVVGGEGLLEAVRDEGLRPVDSVDDEPRALVQGFSPTTTWQMLMEACVCVRAGVPWIVTNADATLPTPRGEGPGNGALVDVVRATTGLDPDEVTGKPHAPIMEEARRRRHAERPLVVGDRLDTDIEAAVAAGMDSLLVLTGVTGLEALLACPADRRPTFVAPDLDGLLREGTVPRAHDGGWCCGDVTVHLEDVHGDLRLRVTGGPSHAELSPEGRPANLAADVLHATAAAFWAGDGDLDLASARRALTPWAAPFGWDR